MPLPAVPGAAMLVFMSKASTNKADRVTAAEGIRPSLKFSFGPERSLGPGKIALIEGIIASGSISAAGRAMGMSYRRAWELVEETNRIFGKPVAIRQTGGKNGGGATLTPLGLAVISRFRAIERAMTDVARDHMAALQTEVDRAADEAS